MGKQMLAQPQVQFPASVWESAGLAKSGREELKGQPRRTGRKATTILKMNKLRPREARGLGAAGRMADNENAKKPRRLAKRG